MDNIREQLLGACVGKPAKIPWPHRLLHEAADHIEALEARQAKLEAVFTAARVLSMDGSWRRLLEANLPGNNLLKALAALEDGDGS